MKLRRATLTGAGWPRPIIGGFPIPWVSPAEDLGKTDESRMVAVKAQSLCQVCGETFADADDTPVVVFVDGGAKSRKPSASVNLHEVLCRAMDDAVMHPSCARLAAGRCPRLCRLREEERFMAYTGPISAIDEFDRPEKEINPDREDTLTFLALDGAEASVFEIGRS